MRLSEIEAKTKARREDNQTAVMGMGKPPHGRRLREKHTMGIGREGLTGVTADVNQKAAGE
jgi:hypothetical protein